MKEPYYIKASGIVYSSELQSIHKSGVQLQPIYEAFMNAWEAIYERFGKDGFQHGKITITLNMEDSLLEGEDAKYKLINIVIEDNGAGINLKSFDRIVNLRDASKGNNNKGTGRVQYLHFFNKTVFDSIYRNGKSQEHIVLTLSKMEPFLKSNAILRLDAKEIIDKGTIGSKVTLESVIDEKKDDLYYNNILPIDIKKELVVHFLSKFCESRDRLPHIAIKRIIGDNKIIQEEYITIDDIPEPEHEESFNVNKSRLDEHNKVVDAIDFEEFQLLTFCRSSEEIPANKIHLVSNGALAQSINVDGLQPADAIDGKRYLFLLRSDYFDSVDNDDRGNLSLVKESDFKKQNEGNLFPEECILIDNVKDKTNAKIAEIYPCFKEKKEKAVQNLEELKELFLIDDDAIDSFKKKIKTSDSDETILKSIYATDSELAARGDAELKKEYESLKMLSPEQEDYEAKINELSTNVAKLIPLQNRNGLTKYIARREIVLKIFQMILDRETARFQKGERINENVLHNLIFHQHSKDTENSDLWLLDDQYLYFKGCSEFMLDKIEIDGMRLIKDELTEEEKEYKERQMYDGIRDQGVQRPDVFLYPDEGKCVIIEFKAPDVDVSKHLDQINRYACLINNLANEPFKIHSFYGYLVGENINYDSIADNNAYFQEAPYLRYIYRTNYPIRSKFGNPEGNLYTEVIKYSDILERAKRRNQIYLDKLNALSK